METPRRHKWRSCALECLKAPPWCQREVIPLNISTALLQYKRNPQLWLHAPHTNIALHFTSSLSTAKDKKWFWCGWFSWKAWGYPIFSLKSYLPIKITNFHTNILDLAGVYTTTSCTKINFCDLVTSTWVQQHSSNLMLPWTGSSQSKGLPILTFQYFPLIG